MAESRTVTVKLTANVDSYVEAMERAKKVTQELLDMGVEKKDLPAALAAVTKLAG